jgi:HEAT repeat protein
MLFWLGAAHAVTVEQVAAKLPRGPFPQDQFMPLMNWLEANQQTASPALVVLLSDPRFSDAMAQWTILEALSRFPAPTVGPAARVRMDAPDDWMLRSSATRAYAAWAERYDPAATSPLVDRMRWDDQCHIRTQAAESLGRIDGERWRSTWIAILADGDVPVAHSVGDCDEQVAAWGLAGAKDAVPTVGPVLNRVLADPRESDEVRFAAARAIRDLAYAGARPTLLAIVRGGDPIGNAKWACEEALGAVGLPEDIPVLQRLVDAEPGTVWSDRGTAAIRQIRARSARTP